MSGIGVPGRSLGRVFEQIDSDFEAHVDVVRSYLRQPSVSETSEGIEDCAALTAELIEKAGGNAEIVATGGHPAVLGDIAGGGPTLLRYGMYDVQPADEPDWTTPPFEASVADLPGVGPSIVARGASNSKACLAAFLLALTSMRKVADLPATINFIVDGEEELGSPNLPSVMKANAERLASDAGFDLDLEADERGVPVVHLGCKGILSIRLSSTGGDWGGPVGKALHSSEGAVVASPAWALVRALSALVDDDERPRLGGIPSGEVPEEDRAIFDALVERFDPQVHLDGAGVRRYKHDEDPAQLLRALVYGPVVNINGLGAGHLGGNKTIVPQAAEAVVDIRLPHTTDPSTVTEELRSTIASTGPGVTVDPLEVCPPSKTSPTSPIARAMIESHADIGHPAEVWPSAPWWAPYYLFEEVLGIPFAHGGAGHSSGAHASNEYASIEGLRQHMKQSIALVFRFAERLSEERSDVG